MARYYRNTGARFWTETGEEIGEGRVFGADPYSPTVRRRLHKLAPVAAIDVPVGLHAIEFGSDAARELAETAGLEAGDFEAVSGSGQGGAYLVDDVRTVAGID